MPTLVRWGWSLGLLLLVVGCGEAAGPVEPSDDWLGAVSQRIDATQYALREVDGALEAGCPAQGLRARFAPDAVTIAGGARADGPLGAAPAAVDLRLRTAGWGRGHDLQALPAAAVAPGACRPDGATDAFGDCLRRAELSRPGLTEWWESRREGLEQGWTIQSAPPGKGELVILVEVLGVEPVVGADAVRLGALRYDGLAAVDADGRALAARFVADPAGIAIHVDVDAAAWPVEVDPLLAVAGWTAEPDVADADFGTSVAGAGDTNGDGYADVVIGAPHFTDGEYDEGAAFLYTGSASGLSATAAWFVQANDSSDNMGYAVAGVGDLNGDGLGDVGVGVPSYSDGETAEGAVFLYYGSASGLPSAPTYILESNLTTALLGRSLDGAGDFNGDGYGDLVAGAPLWDSANGAVFFYTGSASGPPTPSQTCFGSTGEQLGYSVAGLGDVNADGTPDVAAGRPYYISGRGRVQVYLSLATGGCGTDIGPPGMYVWALFGASVAAAGDVNGDGYADLLVGASSGTVSQGDEGYVSLFLGHSGGVSGTAAWTVSPYQANAHLGGSVAGLGDVNGDGYSDIAVGAWAWHDGELGEGGVMQTRWS